MTPAFFGIGEYFDGEPSAMPLTHVLGFELAELTSAAQAILNEPSDSDLTRRLAQTARGVRAYSQFQDLMEGEVTPNPIEGRHYCYFESLVYLRESVLSLLNGQVLGSLALQRPVLELALFHLYWRSRGRGASYSAFYEWLSDAGGKPPYRNAADSIFASLDAVGFVDQLRINEVRAALDSAYGESCAYNHSPRLHESIVTINNGLGPATAPSLIYALDSLNDRLQLLVRLFMLAHPISLFPVDTYRKWGYTGPVGLFWRDTAYRIVRQFIGADECAALRSALEGHPDVVSRLAWFNQHPDLSRQGLEDSWQSFAGADSDLKGIPDHPRRAASAQAHLRAIEWFLSYVAPVSADSQQQ